jgi:signal transduction histidine kinase
MSDELAQPTGPRWAPQIAVLLDDETRVLNVNTSLAGTAFDFVSEAGSTVLHDQLHPACDGKCRFNEMWNKAWGSLSSRDSIEWELDDPLLSRLLRLNLSNAPEPSTVENSRRQRHKLLTVTDITKFRREYEALVEQQKALVRLLIAQGAESAEQAFDETGDTGNRLMAGYVKTERSISHQLILAQEMERKRVAAELHDGIAQTIGVIKYRIEDSVASLAQRYPDIDLSIFDGTVEEIRNLVEEVRRISSNLSPSMLEDFGIQVALDWLCKEFKAQNSELKVNCAVRIDEAETPELVKVAIYRVAQEALNNITKHAAATEVEAVLDSSDGNVELVIADDGAGFDPAEARQGNEGNVGLGLRSMRERVEATGGDFQMTTSPGTGTRIRAHWGAEELQLNQ